jgi:serine/threonine-protein kinase RsbW
VEEHKKDKYELRVKSSTGNLVYIREFIMSACQYHNVNDVDLHNIILAVDEACTNIIKHAYHYNIDKYFSVILNFSENDCKITLVDNGESFNPDVVPKPDMVTYLKQRKVGGLGLHLMKRLMDKVEYSTEENSNRLVMIKKIRK